MSNDKSQRMGELLVESGAFKDLPKPVILTSGELGIYYINTEKLLGDNGVWEKYGDNHVQLIEHANRMMQVNSDFAEAIGIMARAVRDVVAWNGGRYAISGGQRRDWIFSGPLASKLGVPHMALYKQKPGERDRIEPNNKFDGFDIVHVSDLLTEASSAYRIEGSACDEYGWIPMLRNAGASVRNLVTVVDRLQGGRERLRALKPPVLVRSEVDIDEEFLQVHSADKKRALEYHYDPKRWGEEYLRRNGALEFVLYFDPKGGKLDRAQRFAERYLKTLTDAGKRDELSEAVTSKYGITLSGIPVGSA